MKILYVTFDDLKTEVAWTVHVKAVVNGLSRRGHDVKVVAAGGSGPSDLAGEFVPLGTRRSRWGRAAHHLAGSLATLLGAARGFRPDAVYARGIHLSPTPVLAATLLGTPYVVEVNGLLEAEVGGMLRGPVRAMHRIHLSAAAGVVTVTERLKNALCRRYGADADKVHVIPNGADPDRFRPGDARAARAELGLSDGPTLLYTGSFYPHHALDLLPAAAERILRDVPGVRFHFVGDGKTRPEVEGGFLRRGIAGSVRFAGAVPHGDVPRHVVAGDVGLYLLRRPHRDFGFSPIKLFEYLAAGLPVLVSTDLPEIRDFVRRHDVGEAVGLAADRFAEAAVRMLRDPERRRAMGERGRTLVEERYSWDRSVDRVEEVLQTCASR